MTVNQKTQLSTSSLGRILLGKQLGIKNRKQLLRFADIPTSKLMEMQSKGKNPKQIAQSLGVKENDVRLRLEDIMEGKSLQLRQRFSQVY